jgi:hypothetical protein
MTEAKALDISSNNHNGMPFNWSDTKAAGYDVVYIKATQGITYVNPYLIGDVKDAVAAGFKVGIYHMYDTSDPTQQANWFKTNALNQMIDGTKPLSDMLALLPMVDVEGPAGPATDALEVFLNEYLQAVPSVGYMDRNNYSLIKPNFSADWIAWPGWIPADGTSYDAMEFELVQTGQTLVPGIGMGPTGKQLLTDIDTVLDLEMILTVDNVPTPTLEDMSVLQATTNAAGETVIYAVSTASTHDSGNHLYEFTKTATGWSVIDVTDELGGQPYLVQP